VSWLRLPRQGAATKQVSRVLTYGVFILGVVIYLLAVLGSLLSRSQERRLNRAREKAGRLRAVGAVAGGIAHEVRNPLNAISLRLQYLERRMRRTGECPTPEDYARIHLELGKIKKVVDGFVNFARARELTLEAVDLQELLAEVLKSFEPALEEGGIAHELRASGDVVCKVDRERIREVLQAVVANSLESMSEAGKGSLKIRVRGERKRVLVHVRDTGEVLGEGTVERIFEPYFTTRDHALGLGMTVARTLVESHGGSIEAAAVQGGGCLITVALPRSFF